MNRDEDSGPLLSVIGKVGTAATSKHHLTRTPACASGKRPNVRRGSNWYSEPPAAANIYGEQPDPANNQSKKHAVATSLATSLNAES